MAISLANRTFTDRHIGPDQTQLESILKYLNLSDLEDLSSKVIPESIRNRETLDLTFPLTESQSLARLSEIASQNKVADSYMGQGYYDTFLPPVLQRNILENPGWYTAYTPYQAEIAQGRLEMLINFQTMVSDFTGLPIANASLLDEATAAAEAMNLFYAQTRRKRKGTNKFAIVGHVFDSTIAVLHTRAKALGIELVIVGDDLDVNFEELFGALIQNPDGQGRVKDWSKEIATFKENGLSVAMATDLMASCLVKSAGEMGADIAFGNSQRFGVPMGYGGPHAAYFAVKEEYKRNLPGRLIGVSKDSRGKTAYRMSLQTREQHIRREKATSNICTSQVLLAVLATSYSLYHGPNGLRKIAINIHQQAATFANWLKDHGLTPIHSQFFDTIAFKTEKAKEVQERGYNEGINLYRKDDVLQISFDEVKDDETVTKLAYFLSKALGLQDAAYVHTDAIALDELREMDYLKHPVFHANQSEHEMLRYLKKLENRDLSLAHSMISLGSCTMKLNATAEMMPLSLEGFGRIHPMAPWGQTYGYKLLIDELAYWLSKITGFADVSFQPNSGAQGEYAGLLAIRHYLDSKNEQHRDIALIPSSAHGTNPASAVMAGMKVVVVGCDQHGNIDLEDLKLKIEKHQENLAALLVTYPSTHGVFESSIKQICEDVHTAGGQVYMDGANLNAQLGLTSPGFIGADVCHLNLHKTFSIPHGGGGPGVGPIGVAEHLIPYLPSHPLLEKDHHQVIDTRAVSAAPFGSSSILTISHSYVQMMGFGGLQKATQVAILNANYLLKKLEPHYPILYRGESGYCAHEFILDCRTFKTTTGIEVEDISKRLMDYGFHSPTVSFPVAGTLMVEPTESESKQELDKFIEAMISIRQEIKRIEDGEWSKENNPLIRAPHTADMLVDEWERPYTRQEAVYPLESIKENKFWPFVGRIDSAWGDRNLFCSCVWPDENEEE